MVVAVAGSRARLCITNNHWLVILVELPEAAAKDSGFGTAYERWAAEGRPFGRRWPTALLLGVEGWGRRWWLGVITCTGVDRRRRYGDCHNSISGSATLGNFP